jgi:hypothetical protein
MDIQRMLWRAIRKLIYGRTKNLRGDPTRQRLRGGLVLNDPAKLSCFVVGKPPGRLKELSVRHGYARMVLAQDALCQEVT